LFYTIYEIIIGVFEILLNEFEECKASFIGLDLNFDGMMFKIILKNILLLLQDKVQKNIINNLDTDIELMVAVTNDLEKLKNFIKDKINSKIFSPEDLKEIMEYQTKINLFSNNAIELICDKISDGILSDFDQFSSENNNKLIEVDIIIVTLSDYFRDLQIWMLRENFLNLLEKIHVKIISSKYAKTNPLDRGRFEQFIENISY
jgi:hypothetical protein